jgi:uncharacterized repeat protein (TIGR03943 family)
METKRGYSAHYFARAVILLGFAMFIVHLVKSDSLIYYIAPRMENYVKYSAVGLYLVAVHQVYVAIRTFLGDRKSCECDHPPSRSVFRSGVVYSLFLLPLLLGFLMPNVAMSSALADKKGMNLSTNAATKNGAKTEQVASSAAGKGTSPASSVSGPSQPPSQSASIDSAKNAAAALGQQDGSAAGQKNLSGAPTDEELKKMFAPPDAFSDDFSKIGMMLYKKDVIDVKPDMFTEILSSIDLFKDNFYGKKIQISGFVYREDDLKPNQLVVGRFAVSCCTADASPYGVLVEFPSANTFAKDTWVKVTGTIEKGTYHDNDIFKIHATKIEKIAAPKSPYVYPNMDAVAELSKEEKG